MASREAFIASRPSLPNRWQKSSTSSLTAVPFPTLASELHDKTIFIVAGGPSLSPSLDILKKQAKDSIIICVGTSYGLLYKN
ncbi:MAG: DUF115 domain-containing protein, partial [Bacteroidales bacterium]|nr:DUF115 domain-containing protein [Bacteroidales bacterium]